MASCAKHLKVQDEQNDKDEITSTLIDKYNSQMRDLIIRFVKGLSERMETIEKLRFEENWDNMRLELHKLKGVGTSMGYPMITETAAALDYEVMRENEFEVDTLLLDMKNMFERIEKNIPDIINKDKE